MSSPIRVGVIADFDPDFAPHAIVNRVLPHAAEALSSTVEIAWLPTPSLDDEAAVETLAAYDALWCGPGSPYRSLRGALNGIRFARERNYPLLGTCAGFQHIVLEYAINVLGIEDAASEEYDPAASTLFINRLVCSPAGQTLRIRLLPDTTVHRIYDRADIQEHYYCSFGLNPVYRQALESGGLRVTGTDDDGEARVLELPSHRFFIGTHVCAAIVLGSNASARPDRRLSARGPRLSIGAAGP